MEEIVISIAAKVAEYLVDPILQPIRYAFKYQRNMEELKKQVKMLTNRRESVQHSVDEANRQGDEIEKEVQDWLDSVDEFVKKVVKPIIDDQVKVLKLTHERESVQHSVDEANKQGDEIEKQVQEWLNSAVVKPSTDDSVKANKLCSTGFCPNPMTCYSLSKKAAKAVKDGVVLLDQGQFPKVPYRLPPQRTNSLIIKGYEDFASRMSLSERIMEALADTDTDLIGVYGMGGVGKTTLVNKVAQQAKENKLFDAVVTAVVTETPDIIKIQDQIADELGLKFQEPSVRGRAARLRERIKKENRIIVILDNVWAKLDLESIGIPVGGDEKGSITQKVHQKEGDNANKKQCKILFTSRNLDVLRNDMDIQKNFKVEVLCDAEGESLFWKTVGYSQEKSDLNPIAVEIVGKCGGLPVAIKTVANALKNKSLPSWKTARDQLKKANPKNIKGMNEDVYSTIELSFNFLEGEEAKSLFLLCSLCNDGYGVHITDMLKYSMGLGLFQDVYTLEEGRNKLHSLIDDLKTSCLLLDHDNDRNRVKMHDVIHVVAISISATTKLWFNLQNNAGLKEMLEKKLPKDSVAFSIHLRADIYELPEKMEFPKLELFWLYNKDASSQIQDAVFEGMKGLKVLDMTGIHLLPLPSSLCCLINLCTLCLDCSRLEDVAIIGELKELEILSFIKSDIEHLPREIGQLTRLRLLDLSHCSKLKVIEPNVISSLTRLEELYMGNSFDQWDNEGQSNASLAELKQLSFLTALDIHVPNSQIIPHDLSFGKLERYRIFIGDVWDWYGKFETSRTLKFRLSSSIYLSNEIKSLLNKTEDVHLDILKGVKSVVYELSGEGFPQLKHLRVQNGFDIQYIANSFGWGLCNVFPRLESLFLDNLINLEKICHAQLAPQSFSKLRIMKVRKCDRLKHLFSFSMVNNLSQLQEIEVTNCKKLEEIISKESMELVHQNESTWRIEFTQLHTLTLECLPQLTSFSFDASTPDIGSQEIVAEDEADDFMSLFSQNVVLPSLKNLRLSSINIRCTWLDQLPVISSCQALSNLTLEECNDLKFLFSHSIVQSLVQLQKLEIRNCKSIEGIINTEELSGKEKVNMMVFPKLLNLQLKGLPKLSRFSSRNSVEFFSLTQISIEDCPNLKTFFSSSNYVDIKQSKEIEEMNCQDDIYPLFDEKVMLPTLASINLSSIPIRTIWQDQLQPMSSCFQNLKEIIMDGCDTVKHGFPSSMVESLVQLEVLEISNCKLMEVVIVTAGERISNTLFTKLQQLHLKHLPELTTFCNVAGKSIELTSLAELWLENCPKMLAFVSNSQHADMPAAKEEQMNSEKNLQYSHIQPFFDEKVRILDLKFLHIKKMDNMRKIWCHQLIMDSFSKIDCFQVYDCHNLLNIFPSNMFGRLQKLEKLLIERCNSLEVIFEELNTTGRDVEIVPRVVFPQLTWLQLSDLPSLRSFYPGLYIFEWPKLNKLRMWRCNKVETLTSEYSSFEKSYGGRLGSQLENSIQEQLFIVDKVAFPKIEHLALEWNWIVKEILHRNFSKYSCNLKVVELISASKQSGICPCCFLCTLTHLERLDVYFGFFKEIFTCEELDCKKKHAETPSKLSQLKLFYLEDSLLQWEEDSLLCKVFRNLTSLEVLKCGNLKNLVPSFVSFQNLKKLEVLRCDGLVNLMEVSVAKSLVQLTRLKISECKMIEGIIMYGVDEVENWMIFNQLEYLELHSLPKLTSFCSKNCNIDFPSLQQIVVRQCPTMEIFSQGDLSTPKLQRLQTAEVDDEGSWEGSLNTTIQKLFKDMIGFRDFEHLTTSEFPHLKEVWHGQFPVQVFCNLKSLVMDDCENISSAISGNLLQHLNSLEKLHVRNGDSLEEVFDLEELNADGDLKVLSQLSEFFLVDLPRLERIWKKNHSEVMGFRNLKLMKVYNCSNLRYIFTPSVVLGLMQLQELEIKNCAIMEEIITMEGENDAVAIEKITFLQLNCLVVESLPNLTSFYSGSNTLECPSLTTINISNCPKMETYKFLFGEKVQLPTLALLYLSAIASQTISWHNQLQPHSAGFHNLSMFTGDNCDNLKYLFPFSVAESLDNLEVLLICNCKLLEGVIITQGERKSSTPFPKLKQLCLGSLPELTRFCNFNGNPIELPSLSELNIRNCPKMQTFASDSLPGIEETEEVNTETEENLPSFFDEKVQLPTLASLELSSIASQTISWHNQLQAHSACFHNLTKLTIQLCHNLKYLFPFSVAESLDNLEVLDIKYCELLEGVIITQGERKSSTLFPKLKQLYLSYLPELTRFYTFNGYSIELPSLSELNIHNCPKMQTFASDSLPGIEETEEVNTETEENLPSFFDEKVSFSCLKKLELSYLPELLHLWKENSQPRKVFENLAYLEVSGCDNLKTLVPSSVSLQNLETLEVRNCDGLISLVTFSTAKSLKQLKRMEIIDCKLVEEIIIDRGDEIKDVIVFNQLEYLKLQALPSLTSFCKGSFTIEFSYLQRVLVIGCLKMMNFSQGVLSTPKLQSLQMTESSDEGCWEGDLNTTIQKLFRDGVGLRYIENFTVSNFPHLKEVWHEKFLASYFSNLKSLVVDDKCCSLRYIFTPSMALGLVQLRILGIKNCVSLEVITVIGEETISNTMFPNLNSLELINLPNLTCFCNFAGNSIELPSLTQLWIENCPNMETFISNFLGVDMSTSKDNCHTDIQPLFDEKVGLPNLKFIALDKMDKLKKIWHHQLSSDSFCKLDYFGLHDCHNVLNVIPSNMLGRLQKLHELGLTNCSSLCEIFELQASGCGKTQAITATQLEKLWLSDLPKLKHIWDVDSQGLLTCQNLISIQVTGCGSLKSIFPASVGRNLLQLEELCIENCCMVEEIFAKEEQVDEVVPRFPQLTLLRLAELSRLRSFYPRVHISEWPMLKELQVWNCDKVELSASNFLSFKVTHEMPLDQPLLLLDKVPLTNMESLGLDWKWFEKEALHENLPEYSCKLNFLSIKGFHKRADICVFCFLHKLPNLEKLEVSGGFFKGLFLCEGFGCEEKHVEAPTKLSHLRLLKLNDSLHLWEENSLSSKGFQNLAILEVDCCSNIKSLVPSSVSFQNLTRLKVLKCNKLLNLVAIPTAKSLVQLTRLSISECKMVEEIIIHEGDEVKDRIIFKKLRNLDLKCLPSLTSFYPGSCTTVFPNLQQVVVSGCPNMKIFSRGVLSTPRLHKLQTTEDKGKGFWKGNLNTTIEHLFIENGQSSTEN